jgi:hypothetical protein
VPHGRWQTTTFTGAVRLHGMTAPMVLNGPMNGDAFLAYVEQVLCWHRRCGPAMSTGTVPAST